MHLDMLLALRGHEIELWKTHTSEEKNENLFCVFAKLLLSKYAALFQHPQNHLNYARPQAILTTTALTCPLDLAVDMDADWWGLCLDHSWVRHIVNPTGFAEIILLFTVCCDIQGRDDKICCVYLLFPPTHMLQLVLFRHFTSHVS